jgi:hypothetical protein
MSNMIDGTRIPYPDPGLDEWITGHNGLDQDLHDDEAPDPDDDGCDIAPHTRGHYEDDY